MFIFLLFIYWLILFNPIPQLVIPIGIPTKEANAEIEIHPVIVEITVSE